MKDYTSENPQYSGTIRIYDNTDPVDADSVDNVPLIQMQDSIAFLKQQIDEGAGVVEATVQEILDIIDGDYDPYSDGEDDTGEIDDDGTIVEEATQEDIDDIMNSYWND